MGLQEVHFSLRRGPGDLCNGKGITKFIVSHLCLSLILDDPPGEVAGIAWSRSESFVFVCWLWNPAAYDELGLRGIKTREHIAWQYPVYGPFMDISLHSHFTPQQNKPIEISMDAEEFKHLREKYNSSGTDTSKTRADAWGERTEERVKIAQDTVKRRIQFNIDWRPHLFMYRGFHLRCDEILCTRCPLVVILIAQRRFVRRLVMSNASPSLSPLCSWLIFCSRFLSRLLKHMCENRKCNSRNNLCIAASVVY